MPKTTENYKGQQKKKRLLTKKNLRQINTNFSLTKLKWTEHRGIVYLIYREKIAISCQYGNSDPAKLLFRREAKYREAKQN